MQQGAWPPVAHQGRGWLRRRAEAPSRSSTPPAAIHPRDDCMEFLSIFEADPTPQAIRGPRRLRPGSKEDDRSSRVRFSRARALGATGRRTPESVRRGSFRPDRGRWDDDGLWCVERCWAAREMGASSRSRPAPFRRGRSLRVQTTVALCARAATALRLNGPTDAFVAWIGGPATAARGRCREHAGHRYAGREGGPQRSRTDVPP